MSFWNVSCCKLKRHKFSKIDTEAICLLYLFQKTFVFLKTLADARNLHIKCSSLRICRTWGELQMCQTSFIGTSFIVSLASIVKVAFSKENN